MQEILSKFVDSCVEGHQNANTTTDAKKVFKAMINEAYNLGVKDGSKEKEESSEEKSNEEESSKETTQKSSNKESNNQEKSSSQKSQSQEKSNKEENIKKEDNKVPTGTTVLKKKEDAKKALNQF